MSGKHVGGLQGWETAPGQGRAEKRRNYRMLNQKQYETDSIVVFGTEERKSKNGVVCHNSVKRVFRKVSEEEMKAKMAQSPSALVPEMGTNLPGE